MWVIKDDGASWDEAYYRQSIPTEKVTPFLTDSRNVLEPSEVVYLHDSVPCHKANATQALLKDCGIGFLIGRNAQATLPILTINSNGQDEKPDDQRIWCESKIS